MKRVNWWFATGGGTKRGTKRWLETVFLDRGTGRVRRLPKLQLSPEDREGVLQSATRVLAIEQFPATWKYNVTEHGVMMLATVRSESADACRAYCAELLTRKEYAQLPGAADG